MKKEIMICHACGGKMRRGEKVEQFEYKGHPFKLDLPGWYCVNCDESVHIGDDMKMYDRALLDMKAEIDGILRPDEIKAIRKKLNLTQRHAGEILGGGPRAFQKYENGKVTASKPMSNLLIILSHDPKRLKELEGVKKTG